MAAPPAAAGRKKSKLPTGRALQTGGSEARLAVGRNVPGSRRGSRAEAVKGTVSTMTENQTETTQAKRLTKAEMLALLQSEDFDREALVAALEAEQVRTAPFRDRPEVRTHIDEFNEARSKGFQPAVYKKDAEALGVAVKGMISALEAVAEAAGIDLHPEDEED